MSQTFPPPDYIAVESAVSGIEIFKPAPPTAPHREVVTFKCPGCGANTAYSITERGLVCTYCGYHQAPRHGPVGEEAAGFEFTVDVVARASHGWGVARKELVCQNCGAHTTLPAQSLSHTCPFCASNRVVQRQAPQDELRPRFLLPFQVEAEAVRGIARGWLGSSWMMPAGLHQAASRADFIAIYLPGWSFDLRCAGAWQAEVGYKNRDKIKWRWQTGAVRQSFSNHLVSGTARIPPRLLASIWDFRLAGLAPYEPDYLAGFQAQAYDTPLESAWKTAHREIRERTVQAARAQALEADKAQKLRNFTLNVDFADEEWRYLLLPFYLAAYEHGGKTYQVVINGQSGGIAGQRPADWLKVGAVVALLLAAGPLLYLFSILGLSQVTDAASAVACLAVLLSMAGIAAALAILAAAARLDDV
ncbi:MAG: hypothetical protein FJ011_22130 [Chloroflexi bacterium]|nr:hypothetical protein [Chloroflexota bacterium]